MFCAEETDCGKLGLLVIKKNTPSLQGGSPNDSVSKSDVCQLETFLRQGRKGDYRSSVNDCSLSSLNTNSANNLQATDLPQGTGPATSTFEDVSEVMLDNHPGGVVRLSQ